jgi:hypothetical protein
MLLSRAPGRRENRLQHMVIDMLEFTLCGDIIVK